MATTNRYPEALRRRATNEVLEKGRSIAEVASDLGMTNQTLRNWVNQARRDRGLAPGASTEQLARIKELEKEVAELRRSNEILKEATRFFAKEADRPRTK